MSGMKNKPIIITFREKPFDPRESKIQPIDINEETLVYLPEDTEIISYKPKKYIEKGFEKEIMEHTYKGYPWYLFMTILLGFAVYK
jgi:hypothetical protein